MVYGALESVPTLVEQAMQESERLGFGNSSLPEVGRLLGVLAVTPNVRVLQGDWEAILPFGPFQLLFADTKVKFA